MTMDAERPIIRHLASLQADMLVELRQALWGLNDYRRARGETDETYDDDTLRTVDRKLRNVLEYLTGSRD